MTTFVGRLAGAAVALAMTLGGAFAADYRVVSFGDSLSDVGNLFDQTGRPPAPYYKGRFSNGPVWTEILAGGDMRKVSSGAVDNTKDTNFAFGGATAGKGSATPPIPDQIGLYKLSGGAFKAKDVATLLGGANDLLALTAKSTSTQVAAAARKAADDQASNVRSVIGLGAKILIVPNLPPLDKTPRGLGNPALGKVFKAATATYNARLKANLKSIQTANPTVRIVAFDLNGLFAQVAANPSLFGLKDVTSACIAVPACVGGTEAVRNTYLFFDDIHPTAQVHQIVAFMTRWDLEH